MSDQLYPEDVINARPTLRSLAATAKLEAEEEDKRALQRQAEAEAETLIEQTWDFLLDYLELPANLLQEVEFIAGTLSPGRAEIRWEMEGLKFRARPYGAITERNTPIFELNMAPTFGGTSSWKAFTSLATLGALIASLRHA